MRRDKINNSPAKQASGKKERYPLTHASIFITESCNLSCSYCYRPVSEKGRTISEEMGIKALDFLMNHSAPSLSVNFFGGEPLLEFEMLKKLVLYALEIGRQKARRVTFSINTNGIPMNREKIKFLRKYRVGIVLSLDGTPESHDFHRVTGEGRGSFQLLEQNLPLFFEGPRRIHVRMTVTPKTAENLMKSVVFISNLGFMSLAIAIDRTDQDWTPEKREIFKTEYRRVVDWYIDMLREGKNFYLVDLDYGAISLEHPYPEKGIPCAAGLTGIAISIDGKIYPCYRFVGLEGTDIGDVFTGFRQDRRRQFADYSCYGVQQCKSCPLNYRCHRCPWLSFIKTGDLFTPVEINCFEANMMIELFQYFREIMEKEQNPLYIARKKQIEEKFF